MRLTVLMAKNNYITRRGKTYYEEKSKLERTSDTNLASFIEGLRSRYIKSISGSSGDTKSETADSIRIKLYAVIQKIEDYNSNPNNRALFGLLVPETPELGRLQQEKHSLQQSLSSITSPSRIRYDVDYTKEDLGAVLSLAMKRFDQLEKQKEKLEIQKEKTAIIAGYEGKSRVVAKTVKSRLPVNSECPYCGDDIGATPHADHIYPVSKGGRSTIANMVYICSDCNMKKSNKTLREYILKYGLDRDEIEQNLHDLGKSF